jgi:hypothetical protein
MPPTLERILGPRVPRQEVLRHPGRFTIPTVLLVIAAVMMLISYFFPYWNMTLHAPQYPGGLHVQAYLNRLTGDVQEIDGLNHYIGMRPLNEAAQLERSLSFIAVTVQALLVIAAVFIHSRWAAILALPALLFPAGFLADLYFWLHNFGQNLDPHAALSSSIEPFTPPLIGEGKVGQFRTVARVDAGWYIALGASFVILIGLYFHRRAYKPLFEAEIARRGQGSAQKSDEGEMKGQAA